MPAAIDLKWWMRGAECPLEKGLYYLETEWKWDFLSVPHSVVVDSNVFAVGQVEGLAPVPVAPQDCCSDAELNRRLQEAGKLRQGGSGEQGH